ncbi:MAG: class I SAM-dependent methyltransferase [Leptospiraceae bacterium]|nr:class I SAM-dependent methyltransferase [Leptospiraceae bacterium]
MAIETREMYQNRFRETLVFRDKMWKILCKNFFQKFIPEESVVLEVAAGYCEFINNIHAQKKIAVDINTDTKERANKDIEVIINKSSDLSGIQSNTVDVVFMSNFLEHIPKEEILLTFKEVNRILKKNGKLLILQPNIKFVGNDYWMFFDHITPLDHHSLTEALLLTGYRIDTCIPRFLPYTTQSALPKSLLLIKIYLMLPFLWRFFGGQTFVIAGKDSE